MTSAGAKLLGISTPGTEKILEGRAHVLLKACISPECHMLCNRGTMHNLETFLTCPLVPTCQRISKRADDDNEGKGHGSAFWCFSIAVVKFYDDAFFDEASWKTWHNCHRLLWQQTWFSPFCACTITQVPCNPAPSAPFFFFSVSTSPQNGTTCMCCMRMKYFILESGHHTNSSVPVLRNWLPNLSSMIFFCYLCTTSETLFNKVPIVIGLCLSKTQTLMFMTELTIATFSNQVFY